MGVLSGGILSNTGGGGGGGGGTSIGGNVSGGLDKHILFVHPDGTLAQSNNFIFDTVNNFMTIGDGTVFTTIAGNAGKALVIGSSNSDAALILNTEDNLDFGTHNIHAIGGTPYWDLGMPAFDNGKFVLLNLAAGGFPALTFDPSGSGAGTAYFSVPVGISTQPTTWLDINPGSKTEVTDSNAVIQLSGTSTASNVWFNATAGDSNMTWGFGVDGDIKSGVIYDMINHGLWLTPNGGYSPSATPAGGIFVADSNGWAGFGSLNPNAPVHVINGTDGGITPVGDETIIAQRNGSSGDNAIIALVSGDSGIAQIRMGDAALTYNGSISYDNANQELRFEVTNIPRLVMQDSGSIIVADTVQCDLYVNTSNRSANFGDLNAIGLNTLFNLDDNSGFIHMAAPGGTAEVLISAGNNINLSTPDESIDISEGSGITITDGNGAGVTVNSGGGEFTVNCGALFNNGATIEGFIGLHGAVEDPTFSQGTVGQVFTSTGTGSWHWAAGVTVDWNNPGTLGATTPNTVKATTVATTGKVITYNNVATAGGGIPVIRAQSQQAAQTAGQTICTFTPGATGTFIVSGFVNITAVTLDVIKLTVTYKDRNGTSQTLTPLSGLSAIGNSSFTTGEIQCNNTVITVATTLTTGTGSITYDDGATIMQLS